MPKTTYRKPRHKHGRTARYPLPPKQNDSYFAAPISRAVRADTR